MINPATAHYVKSLEAWTPRITYRSTCTVASCLNRCECLNPTPGPPWNTAIKAKLFVAHDTKEYVYSHYSAIAASQAASAPALLSRNPWIAW